MATDGAIVIMYCPTKLWQCIMNEMCSYEWINNTVKYDLMKANWSVIKIITTHLNLRNTLFARLVQTRKTDVTEVWYGLKWVHLPTHRNKWHVTGNSNETCGFHKRWRMWQVDQLLGTAKWLGSMAFVGVKTSMPGIFYSNGYCFKNTLMHFFLVTESILLIKVSLP